MSASSDLGPIMYKTHVRPSESFYERVATLLLKTWGVHYGKEAIIAYDVDYLRWLLRADGSVCITAQCAKELVGCVVASPRTAFSNGHEYKAYYVGLLSTHYEFQNRGIGRELIKRAINECLLRNEADLIIASFEAISPGWPAFLSALRHFEIQVEHRTTNQFTIWGAVFDLRLLNQYEPLSGFKKIFLLPGVRNLIEYKSKPITVSNAVVDTVPQFVYSDFSFGFKADAGLSALYGHTNTKDAGTFQFEFSRKQRCSISFKIERIVKQGLPDVRAGHIQLVHPGRSGAKNLIKAFRFLNNYFLENDCVSAFYLKSAPVSPYVLLKSGFIPTERKVHYGVITPIEKKVKLNLTGKLFLDLV